MRIPAHHRSLRTALAAGAAVALSACAEDAPQDYLSRLAGPAAEKADRLWDLTFWIAVAIFFIVEGVLVYALLRFRHKPGREAAQFHGNTRVEIVLTLVPALILAGIGVPTVKTIFDLAKEPPGALQVEVIAKQFWWEYGYDIDEDGERDFTTANELHVPTGVPVRLTLRGDVANQDVIHSFWVPRLAGTQDVVPGRTNLLTIQADEPGTYLGQCKEFCGLSHANMRLRVIAESPGRFDAWARDQAEPATVAAGSEGARLFVEGRGNGQFASGSPSCAACHAIDGLEGAAGTFGPNLTHFADRATFAGAMFDLDETNLAQWLADPPGVKPGARMPDLGLRQDEIDALVEFLMGLE